MKRYTSVSTPVLRTRPNGLVALSRYYGAAIFVGISAVAVGLAILI